MERKAQYRFQSGTEKVSGRTAKTALRTFFNWRPLFVLCGLLAHSLLFLGCPANTATAVKSKRPAPTIPEKWKEEPIVIVSDSSLYQFMFDKVQSPLIAEHITWYWIHKRTPEILSPLLVFDFESIEAPAEIEAMALFPDGQKWQKSMGFQRTNVPDPGTTTSNRYVQSISMPRYEAGTWLRVKVKRKYHKPEFVPGESLRQRFPVLRRMLSVRTIQAPNFRAGLVNGESLSVHVSQTEHNDTQVRTWASDTLEAIDARNQLSDPSAWYATVRFSCPLPNGSAATWKNLGDHYLAMAKSSITSSPSISQFAKELGDGPKDTLVARAFAALSKRLRYHADEEKLHAFVPRNADFILRQGYGDCKEMSVLLHLILKERNIESYPTLIATPRTGQSQSEYPSLGSFNHMILAIPDEEKNLRFIDPTLGRLPAFRSTMQLANRRVFILRPDLSQLAQIPVGNTPQHEIRTQNTLTESGAGRWTLNGTIELTGVGAQNLYPQLQSLNTEEKTRHLAHYLETLFGLKPSRQSLLVFDPDRIHIEYATDFTDHYIRLEKGGFTLDVPSLFGGRAGFTTLDLEGPREIASTRQWDEWKLPKGFIELESAAITNPFAKGEWKSSSGKVHRNYESTSATWRQIGGDYRSFLSDRERLHKATIWQR